jgi:RNA polymerase sigma-B factor
MRLQPHARTPTQQDPSACDLQMLFRRCSAGDTLAREAIIVRFLPYAHCLARRYQGRGEPVDDLHQVASVGLIKAVDRYEPDRGGSFIAFANPTILGELRRYFRDTTWRVHVPRSIQDRARRVAHAHQQLQAKPGPEPTTKVIAQQLGLKPGDVAEAQGALQSRWPGSLSAANRTDDGQRLALSETVGERDPGYESVETCSGWASALSRLEARECRVLLMCSVGELSQSETARRIGVSQMHVSRIVRHATTALAAALEPE